ncbi:hypothetical protein HDU76_009923 [Blyttiomyces sp. JEL0837]|nr:hypothetical protein HDU76_009923 [Blyttiomyces sp. JEL0837]
MRPLLINQVLIFVASLLIVASTLTVAATGPILGVSNDIAASNSAAASFPRVLNYTTDEQFNFALLNPTPGAVLTGSPISVYYIFYGNFTDLEVSRITNYSKYISAPSTKPNWWSIATKYYDGQGNYVNKHIEFGGSVVDMSYSYGFNLSTTYTSLFNTSGIPIEKSGVARILVDNIGNGKPFSYDPHGIYCVITAPEIKLQDKKLSYSAYHFSFNTTIDGQERLLNHALAHTLTAKKHVASIDTAPNGDTGRNVADAVTYSLHHEIFEATSDPSPDFNTGWQDVSNLHVSEIGDACEYSNSITPNLRFTESTLNATGRHYNTIINGQLYLFQSIWGFDDEGIQSCYVSTIHTRLNEFKAVSAAVNPVTAADGIKNYTGPINIPCKGFYNTRSWGGYHTLGGPDVCRIMYQDFSAYYYARRQLVMVNATFDIPKNYNVLSHNHAHYQWRLASEVNEANAIQVFDDDVNPPTVTDDGKVLVVFQDNWRLEENGVGYKKQVDHGAYYWCRALVDGVWYVGETNKFIDTCILNANGVYKSVKKTDSSVWLLVKPAPRS